MLVRTPLPEKTESALGFALRVSETNGYDTPWHVFNLAGISQGKMVNAGFHVEMLANVLGCEPSALEHMSYVEHAGDKKRFKILGHSLGEALSKSPLQLKTPKFCPDCAKEAGFIDAFWDLTAAIACPRHGKKALSVCPVCKEELRWFRPGLTTCRCGADLESAPGDDVKTPVREFMGLLMAKLHRVPLSECPNTSGFPLDILDPLPLLSMTTLVWILGDLNRKSYGDTLTFSAISDTELAIETLANWPAGHYQFLHRIGEVFLKERPNVLGLVKQFDSYCNRIYDNECLADYAEPFKKVFAEFGATQWGRATVDGKQKIAKKLDIKQRFIPLSKFARQHRLTAPVVNRLIAQGDIVIERVGDGVSSRIIVDTERSLKDIGEAGSIGIRKAAELMGLPVSVIKHLRAIGTIQPKLRRGLATAWHSEDVAAFMKTSLADIALVESMPPESISLAKVMRLKFRNAAAKAALADKALKGELQVLGRTGNDFGSLLLSLEDIDSMALETRVKLADNTYAFPEAAKLCGIDMTCVESAVETGLLATVCIDARTRVTKSSIDAFVAAFVTLATLADELGTTSLRLRNECENLNIPLGFLARKGMDKTQAIIARTDAPTLIDRIKASQAEREAAIARKRPGVKHPLSADIANSGLTATEYYLRKLQAYLDGLTAAGDTLPRRDGLPNKGVIARACGFGRGVLYDYQPVIAVLEQFSQDERLRLAEKAMAPIEKLKHYLERKEAAGDPLPRCANGDLNKLKISKEAGFHRNLLYNNPEALKLLNAEEGKAA